MDQANKPLMVFVTVAGIRAAVPAAFVRAVTRPLPTKRLGRAPAWCPGAAVFRGELVPVVDLAALLFGTTSEARRMLVLELPGTPNPRRLGLLIREVHGLKRLEAQEDLPSILQVSEALVSATLDEALTVALQPTRLLREEDWAALSAGEDA